MFYGDKFQTVDEFVYCVEEYIHFYKNIRIYFKLKEISPV